MRCVDAAPALGVERSTLAIVYGTVGGLSDVGKFCVAQARAMPGVRVRALALYDGATQTADREAAVRADVTDAALNAALEETLRAADVRLVDVHSADAAAALEAAIVGADAVISCISSRQPDLPRYLAVGTRKVIAAMHKGRVRRLVCLSSFGIGPDVLPASPIKLLWGCLLKTLFRAAARDLEAMESDVVASGLDYALLRPVGLTPTEPVLGRYAILSARGQGAIKIEIAKADMARCALDEALSPTVRAAGVTVGQRPA